MARETASALHFDFAPLMPVSWNDGEVWCGAGPERQLLPLHMRLWKTQKAARCVENLWHYPVGWATAVALTLRLQQRKFGQFRLMFNHERQHEAPNNATPGCLYQPSSVVLPRTLIKFVYRSLRGSASSQRFRAPVHVGDFSAMDSQSIVAERIGDFALTDNREVSIATQTGFPIERNSKLLLVRTSISNRSSANPCDCREVDSSEGANLRLLAMVHTCNPAPTSTGLTVR